MAGRLLERPGPTVHPMAWVDTRACQKQPAFSGCFGQAVRGRGPSVGHGYKNVKGQGTVTTPMPPTLLDAVRTGEGSVAISVTVLLPAMPQSSWWTDNLER